MSEGTKSAEPGETASTTPVELRVRAQYGQLPVLRTMAEAIAVLADFDLDAVSDVKLAVDEVCSQLIQDAAAGTDLICRFQLVDDALHVHVWTDTVSGHLPDKQGFGWHVLRTLTDSLGVTHEPSDRGTVRTTIAFTRVRGGDG